MASKGVDILIMVDTGTEGSPQWTPVGGQRGATLSESVETIDVTHKASGGHKEYEYGDDEWTISCDGVYIKDDAAYVALVDAMRQKKKIKVRWQEAGTDTFEGTALVTSRDLEGPYDGEATYSMELQGTGAPTALPTDASNNLSSLAGIEQKGAAALVLVPEFAGGTSNYVVSVAAASSWVKFTPTASNGIITINGAVVSSGTQSGEIALGAAGSLTTITIQVAESGKAAKTYTIIVARAAS